MVLNISVTFVIFVVKGCIFDYCNFTQLQPDFSYDVKRSWAEDNS